MTDISKALKEKLSKEGLFDEECKKYINNKAREFILENGISGIWNDMNEPASFNGPLPDDVVFTDEGRKTNHAEMHNVYGHNMSRATFQGLKEQTGKRPFT